MEPAQNISNETDEPSHLYLIDGYGFVFRAYHSLPPLTDPEGTPVGAVYGFTNMIMKLKQQARGNGGTAMVMVFDSGSKTFRNEIYGEYKANRPPAPEDLIPQFPLVAKAAEALSIPSVSVTGFEADDIIATYAEKARKEGIKVTIVSSDKDLMQLIDGEYVTMLDAMKNRTIDAPQVEEKFGVSPEKVLDMLSLMGDSADNIPGVPGIGPKTAAELLNKYETLENLLENAHEIKQNKRRENLIEFADQARLSKELATLRFDVPLDDALIHQPLAPEDPNILIPFLQKHGFKSLANKLAAEHASDLAGLDRGESSSIETPKADHTLVKTENDLKNWLQQGEHCGHISILPITWKDGTILTYSLAYIDQNSNQASACTVKMATTSDSEQDDLFGDPTAQKSTSGITEQQLKSILAPILSAPHILKIAHDIKYLSTHFENSSLTPLDDTLVMAYTLDGSLYKRDLEVQIEQHLGETIQLPESIVKTKPTTEEVDYEAILEACGNQAVALIRLQKMFRKRLFDEKMLTLYETMERPLVSTLSKMEQEGILLDTQVLQTLTDQFNSRIKTAEQAVFAIAGHEFNLGSPKQLGEVLFEKMQLEGGKKSKKSGAWTTDSDTLEALAASGQEIAQHVLEFRMLSKLVSTYTTALPKQINATTGRVHTHFGMANTTTGRLSSDNPNLQNIPIRTEEGRIIRNAFVAKKGCLLVGADYSQIELRLLAHMANIDTLKTAFKEGKDIHSLTASQVFGIALEDVSGEQRRAAKAINFGIIYGQSAFGLAASLGISRSDAKTYIEAYFTQYPGIRAYMDTTKEQAHEKGYVETLYGRKCHLPGINTKGPQRAFAERAAINAPLQGTAADIIKKAMLAIDQKLSTMNTETKMLLQVHDELILEAPEAEAENIAKMVKREMEQVAQLSIPLTVDAKTGTHWGEIH